jgi:hypothetical protein
MQILDGLCNFVNSTGYAYLQASYQLGVYMQMLMHLFTISAFAPYFCYPYLHNNYTQIGNKPILNDFKNNLNYF